MAGPWRTLALVGAAVATLAATALQQPEPGGLTWLATGDSFSSGEGVDGASGRCASSPRAYPLLARDLVIEAGVDVDRLVHAACTRVDASGLWLQPPRGQPILLELAESLGLPPGRSADVVTMTMGGNEIGFADVIRDCAGFEITREALLDPGCNLDADELFDRVDALAVDGVALPDGPGSVADLLVQLAAERLRPDGLMVVPGYPVLFADPHDWDTDELVDGRCAAVAPGDAAMLNRVNDRLVDVLADQVAEADRRTEATITFVEVRDRFTSEHRICGKGVPWVNGLVLTTGETLLDTRGHGSYHLNGAGHAAIADAVAVAVTTWAASVPAGRGGG